MSSWIKKPKSLLRLNGDCEEIACSSDDAAVLDAFRNHWRQAWAVMCNKSSPGINGSPVHLAATIAPDVDHDSNDANASLDEEKPVEPLTSDDVTSVVNHIDQMIQLLMQEYRTRMQWESRRMQSNPESNSSHFESNPIMMSPLLDYLLMESILDKLFQWSLTVGEFTNCIKLEQLKLYELLVSELCHQSILFQTALIRPLLHLLSTCKDCAPLEVEKRLVNLLSTLCLLLSQNAELLELFFVNESTSRTNITRSMDEVKQSPAFKKRLSYLDSAESRFLIFSLLISYVHRDGTIGQQAREALLLIMSLSRKHEAIGVYIAENSDFCPVLATGLSGLYSLLPRKLLTQVMQADDWHQLTSEDVQEIGELNNFLTSLRFCNAVVQVSHTLVKQQLLEYISQGFLVSVIGPALHQDIMHIPLDVLEKYQKFTNTIEEITATTAYLELCLRTVTEPNLLEVFLRFICVGEFDGQRILDTLVSRITSNKKLCLVTIVLFRTLLDLNCEDVLYELVLRHLGSLAFLGDRTSTQLALAGDCSQLDHSARRLLSYIPCVTSRGQSQRTLSQLSALDLERLEAISLDPTVSSKSTIHENGYNSLNSIDSIERVELSLSAALSTPALMDNFVEYLNDAHQSIRECGKACSNWSNVYSLEPTSSERNFDSGININSLSHKEPDDSDVGRNGVAWSIRHEQLACTEDYFDANEEIERELIGPFLSHLLTKLESVHQNDVCTNLQLTGLWARLLVFPQPILRAYLLNDRVQVHPRVRTLWRSLAKNQQRLQRLATQCNNFSSLLENSKAYFIQREQLLLDRIESSIESASELNGLPSRHSRSGSVTSEQITISIEPNKDNKRNTLRNFWNKLRSDKTTQPFQREEIGFVGTVKPNNVVKSLRPEIISINAMSESQRLALNIFIYQEFIKELSAICQEHYILENAPELSILNELHTVDSIQYRSSTDLSVC